MILGVEVFENMIGIIGVVWNDLVKGGEFVKF